MSSRAPTVAATSISKAVVPAAGMGTRLRPLTPAIPKELLPIGREPVLSLVVKELQAAGVTQVLFVISDQKPQIRSYFGDCFVGDDGLPPVDCEYVIQSQQRGSGDALLCAAEWVGDDSCVVAFGDCVIESEAPGAPLRRVVATHRRRQATATILVEEVERSKVSRYGVVAPAAEIGESPSDPFPLRDLLEKPSIAAAPSNLVVAARWAVEPAIFEPLRRSKPDARGELNIPDALRPLLLAGAPCWAVPLRSGETRRDIGNLESFLTQFVRAALRDPEFGAAVREMARLELLKG